MFQFQYKAIYWRFYYEQTACTQNREKKRGKVFSHQLSQRDHHENDRLDVHFKYIFCVSLNLKSATFLGLQSDKGQIEFNLRKSLWLWSAEPEILEQA